MTRSSCEMKYQIISLYFFILKKKLDLKLFLFI